MIDTVFFDLDNTLVLYDESTFYNRYFQRIAAFFEDLIPGERFLNRLMAATRFLLKNDGSRTNRQRFLSAFTDGLELGEAVLWERFHRFYENEYPSLGDGVTAARGLDTVFDTLRAGDLTLVVATNPIFPETAQRTRLGWAGLDHGSFALVTDIDNMSYCKPNPAYYREICRQIARRPEQCLMVGNDPVNDAAAALAGIATYRTTDAGELGYESLKLSEQLMPEPAPTVPEPAFTGPIARLPEVLEHLMAER